MATYEAMSNRELVEAYNAMAETAGMRGREVTQVKKFRDRHTAIDRCRKLAAIIHPGVNGSLAAEAPAAEPAAEKKAETKVEKKKVSKSDSAEEDIVLTYVRPNPRRKGTRAFDVYSEMEAYVKNNPGCRLGDIYANTNYLPIDYRSDFTRGNIK